MADHSNGGAATARVAIRRSDYREPEFWIPRAELAFDLGLEQTTISSRLFVRRNLRGGCSGAPLVLDGHSFELLSLAVGGKRLASDAYVRKESRLIIPSVPDELTFECVTRVTPRTNTTLMGLCPSKDGDLYTQCEAEAFRKLTYFLDRPDVLCIYTVTLRAERAQFPVLLSNGNPIDSGDLPDGRHYAIWHDPIPKPSYIFAMLAGDLTSLVVEYRTRSGRTIKVGLHTRERYFNLCRPALDGLLRAMEWDERVFNREYDLDVFNMGVLNGFPGAMENKGLNLFDINWVVVDPAITLDSEYEYRLKSIAHEYFHNWSGDRVTVRNWFHTTLKEGLTRFRDQLFLADETEFAAVRINMARHIRSNQFSEDASAVVHACVWDEYVEPRNLYTFTVYDKGQEIIFMLLQLLGRERLCAALSHVFDQFASQAITTDEMLEALSQHAEVDLEQFRLWYYTAGTAEVSVRTYYDETTGRFTLELEQRIAGPGGAGSGPLHVPLSFALLARDGTPMTARLGSEAQAAAGTRVHQLRRHAERLEFSEVPHAPVVSLLRDFSAPIRLHTERSDADLAVLTRCDDNMFARWDAAQTYAARVILRLAREPADPVPHEFIASFSTALTDTRVSARLRAELLQLPDERFVGELQPQIDVDGVHRARGTLMGALALANQKLLLDTYFVHGDTGDHDLSAETVGRRRLRNLCLEYLLYLDEPRWHALAYEQLTCRNNITDQSASLLALCTVDSSLAQAGLEWFRARWQDNQLALDKWYRIIALAPTAEAPRRVSAVMNDPGFDLGVFSRLYVICEHFYFLNRYGFNEPAGRGYDLLVEQMLRIDRVIPLMSAWTLTRCDVMRWWRFDPARQTRMRKALESLRSAPGLSAGVEELCRKALEGAPHTS